MGEPASWSPTRPEPPPPWTRLQIWIEGISGRSPSVGSVLNGWLRTTSRSTHPSSAEAASVLQVWVHRWRVRHGRNAVQDRNVFMETNSWEPPSQDSLLDFGGGPRRVFQPVDDETAAAALAPGPWDRSSARGLGPLSRCQHDFSRSIRRRRRLPGLLVRRSRTASLPRPQGSACRSCCCSGECIEGDQGLLADQRSLAPDVPTLGRSLPSASIRAPRITWRQPAAHPS